MFSRWSDFLNHKICTRETHHQMRDRKRHMKLISGQDFINMICSSSMLLYYDVFIDFFQLSVPTAVFSSLLIALFISQFDIYQRLIFFDLIQSGYRWSGHFLLMICQRFRQSFSSWSIWICFQNISKSTVFEFNPQKLILAFLYSSSFDIAFG